MLPANNEKSSIDPRCSAFDNSRVGHKDDLEMLVHTFMLDTFGKGSLVKEVRIGNKSNKVFTMSSFDEKFLLSNKTSCGICILLKFEIATVKQKFRIDFNGENFTELEKKEISEVFYRITSSWMGGNREIATLPKRESSNTIKIEAKERKLKPIKTIRIESEDEGESAPVNPVKIEPRNEIESDSESLERIIISDESESENAAEVGSVNRCCIKKLIARTRGTVAKVILVSTLALVVFVSYIRAD